MTLSDMYDLWRITNIVLAIAGCILTTIKVMESWKRNDFDVRMGRMSVPMFCFCIALGSVLAMLNHVKTGIWSTPVTIPLLWANLYGAFGVGSLTVRLRRGE